MADLPPPPPQQFDEFNYIWKRWLYSVWEWIKGVDEVTEWTPTIDGLTSAGAGTYTIQAGYTQKIGKMRYVQGYLHWTGHTGTGDIQISGMPESTSAVTAARAPLAHYHASLALTAGNVLELLFDTDATTITIRQIPTGGGTPVAVPMDTVGILIFSGTYFTD